ncbi:MAG: type II toxin-antitoxin system Phd/YefM family antitoxin [Desertimonas sp.]
MSTIPIRTARADLASLVRRAAHGETTVIAVHGRPMARVAPLSGAEGDLDGLIACGAVVAPRRTTPWRPPVAVPIPPGTRLDRTAAEIR